MEVTWLRLKFHAFCAVRQDMIPDGRAQNIAPVATFNSAQNAGPEGTNVPSAAKIR